MIRWLLSAIAISTGAILSGCGSNLPMPTPSPTIRYVTQMTCADVESSANADVACVEIAENTLLLQSIDDETTMLWLENMILSFPSTIYWSTDANQMTIAALENVAIISVSGVTRIVQPGGQIEIPLAENTLSAIAEPTLPEPYAINALWNAPLDQLPRIITLPDPIVVESPVTAQPGLILTIDIPSCPPPPEDWTGTYTIQRGDTLTRIASTHDITVDELQNANCLQNPNRIAPGDVLLVPVTIQAGASTLVTFSVQNDSLASGECTIITWQAEDARLVAFEGEAVSRSDSREVCPQVTTTYTLIVTLENGEQIEYPLVVSVQTP